MSQVRPNSDNVDHKDESEDEIEDDWENDEDEDDEDENDEDENEVKTNQCSENRLGLFSLFKRFEQHPAQTYARGSLSLFEPKFKKLEKLASRSSLWRVQKGTVHFG